MARRLVIIALEWNRTGVLPLSTARLQGFAACWEDLGEAWGITG